MLINSKAGDKVFVSWSGGKDSYLAFILAKEKGLNPVCLLSFVGADGQSRSHGLKTEMLEMQAKALGLPLHTEEVTWEGYEFGFEKAVDCLKKEYGITGGIFGDVNLDEHREWVEKMSKRCEIDYNLPLWLMNERLVSEELIRRGGRAMLVAIRSDLVDQKWLGKFMDKEYINYCISIGISPCGEGGEAHTLVVDGPCFGHPLTYTTGKIKYLDNHALFEVNPA
ncbi:MAG: adenine nucleotide alpha hydrolase [Firmicutes bacterium]|nr:adenine nucleotide alpha hydrolase [Bacillota bacterium]